MGETRETNAYEEELLDYDEEEEKVPDPAITIANGEAGGGILEEGCGCSDRKYTNLPAKFSCLLHNVTLHEDNVQISLLCKELVKQCKMFGGNVHISFGASMSASAGVVGRAVEAYIHAGNGGVAACYTYSSSKVR